MISNLDANALVWLAGGNTERISEPAMRVIEEAEILVSPMVLLELEYLYDIGKIRLRSRDIFLKMESEMDLRVCDMPFHSIAAIALDEKWTRDPFDRLIVANAKANGLSVLVSSDEEIQRNYPKAVW